MDLIPWKYMNELSTLRKGMEDLWSRFAGEAGLAGAGAGWNPRVDVSETHDAFVVKAELPGIDVKDIEVALTGSVLTVRGEKKEEKEEKDRQHYYSERYYGSFRRAFRLPGEVSGENVAASFDRGVLTITAPKAVAAQKKKVEIKVK